MADLNLAVSGVSRTVAPGTVIPNRALGLSGWFAPPGFGGPLFGVSSTGAVGTVIYTPPLPAPLPATGYWASPTGAAAWANAYSETPLSGTACCSLTTASTNVSAGNTVYLRAGTYHVASTWSHSGTAGNRITITNYNDETVIIDGSMHTIPGSIWGPLFNITGSYVTASNLSVTRSSGYGVMVADAAHYVTLDNIYSYQNWAGGISHSGWYGLTNNCRAWNNSLMNEDFIWSESGWSTGISTCRYSEHSIIRGCTSWDNWGEGISTFETRYQTIEDCISYNNQGNFYISDTAHGLFQRNLSYFTPGNMVGEYFPYQSCFALGDERPDGEGYSSHDNIVINNLGMGGKRVFTAEGADLTDCLVANNTFVNASAATRDYAVLFYTGTSSGGRFANNIILQEDDTPIGYSGATGITFDHNNWSKAGATNCGGTGDVVGDPLLAETGPTGAGLLTYAWFSLSGTSPGLGQADVISEVTEDFLETARGATPDMGALEYIHWADSPARADVVAAIALASDGDTIRIPEGTGSATWASQIYTTKAVNVIGPGKDNLTITGDFSGTLYSSAEAIICYQLKDSTVRTLRISGITFDGGGLCNPLRIENEHPTGNPLRIRIDDCAFQHLGGSHVWIYTLGTVYGVVDHCILDSASDEWNTICPYGSDAVSWTYTQYEFGDADNLYFEDNVFNITDTWAMGGSGGRVASRHNTFNYVGPEVSAIQFWDAHGNYKGIHHSTMGIEAYENTINCAGNLAYGFFWCDLRGGKGLFYNNYLTNFSGYLQMNIREEDFEAGDHAKGGHDANNPPAVDAINGQTQHVSGTYCFNTYVGGAKYYSPGSYNYWPTITGTIDYADSEFEDYDPAYASYGVVPRENVHFWFEKSTFDGSIGVGAGILVARPATCTVGVGYWATDENKLYRCTATNVWTLYYQPYTYPHPFQSDPILGD